MSWGLARGTISATSNDSARSPRTASSPPSWALLADEIALKSPMCVRLMKESINLTEDMPVIEGYRVEQLYTTLASSMDESKEASAAFLEKREPRWVTELKDETA